MMYGLYKLSKRINHTIPITCNEITSIRYYGIRSDPNC